MSNLHELAEMYRNEKPDRRRDEWAQVRADIGALLRFIEHPLLRQNIIRAYHAGYKRGGQLAAPRPTETVRAENWGDFE